MQIKILGACHTLDCKEVEKWSEYQVRVCLFKAKQDATKRKILELIKKYKNLVIECLDIQDIDKELNQLIDIDYSNTGMLKSDVPFKVIKRG